MESSVQAPLPHPLPSDDDGANSDDDPASLPSPLPLPDPLLHASVLTQEQLLHRRASRLRHLLRIYRAQYWGLLEEMRSKYRRFYLRHGKSGWRRDHSPTIRDVPTDLPPAEMKQPHAPESDTVSHCGAQGCLAKPLLLSSYCYTHILQEPRQRLYKPCSFIVRRSRSTHFLLSTSFFLSFYFLHRSLSHSLFICRSLLLTMMLKP